MGGSRRCLFGNHILSHAQKLSSDLRAVLGSTIPNHNGTGRTTARGWDSSAHRNGEEDD